MISLIFTILLFLLLSAFFSGSEIAFVSADKLDIAVKKENESRRGTILAQFYEQPKDFISTMLVGNNISLVAFTYFTTQLLSNFLETFVGDGLLSLLVYTLLITIVVLIFGEFLPKTFFRINANKFLYNLTYPLYFFKKFLWLPTAFMSGLSNFFLKRIIKVPLESDHKVLTRLDLEHYIEHSISESEDDIDKEILTNALNLENEKVRDCMVPRTEIVYIEKDDSIDELTQLFIESRHSRIIAIDGDIDNIEGYIHHQQLLKNPKTIAKNILEILYVPEAMNLKDLMQLFTKKKTTIAIVVDEFGGTSGIITLEDILEEIFGEIEDEHDHEDFVEAQVNENEFLFAGRLEIDYLNEKYEILDLPEGEYQTLSGYIVMTSESIPEHKDEIILENYKFILEQVSDTKIELVRLIKLETKEKEEG